MFKTQSTIAWAAVICINGCSGEGGDFSAVEQTVVGTCGNCHDPDDFENLVNDIESLDDGVFTEASFPDDMFPATLRTQSVADLIEAANPPRDATLDPNAPLRQAWILHLMHELELQLEGSPPSDFTSEASFNAYNAGGDPPFGCTSIERVQDFAEFNLPQQMPPLWTEPLFVALGRAFSALSDDERMTLVETIQAGLPGGTAACGF
ncbi:MAG: hypothetical protein ACFB9M_03640 [Myxococcota bacterium]